MKVSSLIIDNVKSFRDRTEITFNSNMNVLIGPNGGGKSNIMSILSWLFNSYFRSPFQLVRSEKNNAVAMELQKINSQRPEKHWGRTGESSYVIIELEATEPDIEIIEAIVRQKEDLLSKYRNLLSCSDNDIPYDIDDYIQDISNNLSKDNSYKSGEKFRFKVELDDYSRKSFANELPIVAVNSKGNKLAGNKHIKAMGFLDYVKQSEVFNLIMKDKEDIFYPYLHFGPMRKMHNLQINLNSHPSFYQNHHAHQQEMANVIGNEESGSQRSSEAAATHLADMAHELIYMHGNEEANKRFIEENVCKKLKSNLFDFGFDWELKILNRRQNLFEVQFSRNQENEFFRAEQGSSGERQIFNFVLSLTCLNMKDTLIVIDEPELHLHPRWQKQLAKLFERLSKELSCQFVVTTHSANFITESGLENVVRVYREEEQTKLLYAEDGLKELPAKDVLKMFNAHNNERIFFAEKVVLVEGPSDYVVWKSIIELLMNILGRSDIVEVIEVHGKGNFDKYKAFLDGLRLSSTIIADFDYLFTIKDEAIKEAQNKVDLNHDEQKEASKKLLKKHSLDGQALVKEIENKLAGGCDEQLHVLLEYIKSRYKKYSNLDIELKAVFDSYRKESSKKGLWFLSKGELEDYQLIKSHDGDDLTKAIKFAKNEENLLFEIGLGALKILDSGKLQESEVEIAEEAEEFLIIAFDALGINKAEFQQNAQMLIEHVGEGFNDRK